MGGIQGNDLGERSGLKHSVTTSIQLAWICTLMLPSAYSYALTVVSLYASGELVWGSTNGTTTTLPYALGHHLFLLFVQLFLFPEDLATVTAALTKPDGERTRAQTMQRHRKIDCK